MATIEKTVLADNDTIFTLSSFLSAEECVELIRRTEATGFRDAPITTSRGFVMRPEIRNNTRVMQDDTARAASLWDRLAGFVAPRVDRWIAIGLNERLRYYRYDVAEYFKWHRDGAFVRSPTERSLFTAMIYLNDDFEGGTTDFEDGPVIVPQRGMALLFEHRQGHQGAAVTRGRKYVLRTDVMYRQG